jgi:putative peptidoglycan lipid II flippase
MGNESQLPPQPEQNSGKGEREGYWQYEQDEITEKYPVRRQQPQQRPYPPGAHTARQLPPFARRYEQAVPDAGTSLGYGQGTEYAYLEMGQPSQALPVLRQFTGQHEHVQEQEMASAQNSGALERVKIGRDALILTVASVASSILGLLRGSLFTAVFGGSSPIFDAYNQAFLMPNLIFTMVAGGALSSAFIPVFKTYMAGEQDEKTAWHVTSSALNLATALLMALALLMIIFAGQIVPLYNYGVSKNELDLIISLTRIMLLQPIIMGASIIIAAILQAHQRFLLYALGMVLYNVGIIGGFLIGVALAAAQHLHTGADTFRIIVVYAATCGVVLGALLQIGIQLPGLARVGMRYTFSFDWQHTGVQKIGLQMVPRIINAAMLNVSTAVDRNLILFLVIVVGSAVNGLISQYLLAFTLVQLPINIFGGNILAGTIRNGSDGYRFEHGGA